MKHRIRSWILWALLLALPVTAGCAREAAESAAAAAASEAETEAAADLTAADASAGEETDAAEEDAGTAGEAASGGVSEAGAAGCGEITIAEASADNTRLTAGSVAVTVSGDALSGSVEADGVSSVTLTLSGGATLDGETSGNVTVS